MSWIGRRWRPVALLALAIAAIAVPAWASSGGSGGVQRATEPSSVDPGQVAPAASGGRAELPLPPPTRAQLDRSVRCMADHGFGMGSANDRHGTFIPRAETQTPEFRRAAKDCELPPPPTDAQIARIGCAAAQARREGAD